MSKLDPHKKPAIDQALVGKQQLLIKSKLQQSALVAKQQLAIKSALASQRSVNGSAK